jgi:hypothetical protein
VSLGAAPTGIEGRLTLIVSLTRAAHVDRATYLPQAFFSPGQPGEVPVDHPSVSDQGSNGPSGPSTAPSNP